MKFGAVPVARAEGGIAVHSIRKDGMVLKKGTAIGKVEIAALRAAGVAEIVVARLEPDDVPEDVAAAEIAAAVAGEGTRIDRAFTGARQPVRRGGGRAGGRQGRDRPSQPGR
jgi:molybdenum cofactor cytidylyltransferase